MKTKPNIKIIIHWVLITMCIVTLLLYIQVNTSGFLILIGLLIITLILHQTSIVELNDTNFIITKHNFLFIQTYHESFELQLIKKIEVYHYGFDLPGIGDPITSFKYSLLFELFTGYYFYKPRIELYIECSGKNSKIKINTSPRDFNRIEENLKKVLDDNLVINKN